MSTGMPRASDERRIILLYPTALPDATATAQPAPREHDAAASSALQEREVAARHYLKFMLPGIPVTTFILTFVLCDVLLGVQSATLAAMTHITPPIGAPILPLLAAVTMSMITGALCMWIYFGYLRIMQHNASTQV